MIGRMAFDCMMSAYGYSCRLNQWRKTLLKIATKSWRDNQLLYHSFLSFVFPASSEVRLDTDITCLPTVSKSIESFLLCPCNPQIFCPTPPVLNRSNQDTLHEFSFTILCQLRSQIAPILSPRRRVHAPFRPLSLKGWYSHLHVLLIRSSVCTFD